MQARTMRPLYKPTTAASLDPDGSDGALVTLTSTGFQATPTLTDVTPVSSSIPCGGTDIESVGLNSLSVGTVPTAAAPEPATLTSVGIAGLIGLGESWRRQDA
jgi:hypothetical protein